MCQDHYNLYESCKHEVYVGREKCLAKQNIIMRFFYNEVCMQGFVNEHIRDKKCSACVEKENSASEASKKSGKWSR